MPLFGNKDVSVSASGGCVGGRNGQGSGSPVPVSSTGDTLLIRFRVLRFVVKNLIGGPMTHREIAQRSGVEQATIRGIAGRISDDGFMRRMDDYRERRKQRERDRRFRQRQRLKKQRWPS